MATIADRLMEIDALRRGPSTPDSEARIAWLEEWVERARERGRRRVKEWRQRHKDSGQSARTALAKKIDSTARQVEYYSAAVDTAPDEPRANFNREHARQAAERLAGYRTQWEETYGAESASD